MDFRTPIVPPAYPFRLGLHDPVLSFGSCFALSMGEFLAKNRFSVVCNPFGTLFHPQVIWQRLWPGEEGPAPHRFVQREGLWFHYDYHSSLWGKSQADLSGKIQAQHRRVEGFLKKSRLLILTLGSAWAYRWRHDGQLVANNHKQAASEFEKVLSSPEAIEQAFGQWHSAMRAHYPQLNFLLTVSPVRHLRDTLPLSQVSKSVLRYAVHNLVSNYDKTYYFPAYEMLLDDLRDYRFYEADMLHPNQTAQAYIAHHFGESLLDAEAQAWLREWQLLLPALLHRALHPDSEAHQAFQRQTQARKAALLAKYGLSEEGEAAL
ncbi:MAG: GSCFA domain-containing protein [Microscillaceae bacterium]